MNYTINVHRHRFAAWAAANAASVSGCHFSVEQANAVIVAVGLNKLLANPDRLPAPSNIDKAHKKWRRKIVAAAKRRGLNGFTHGVAAKLINVYLKSGFVCGGYHEHYRVKALHPPIDSQILNELYKKNYGNRKKVWGEARKKRWSNMDSRLYEKVITNIRQSEPNKALWEVEKYWPGYRHSNR